MERVLIIGSNGAGKTTFSYSLSGKTGLPLIHIDKIYWQNYWEVTPQREFLEKVLAEVQKPKWIIEGNNLSSLSQRLPYADTVFWFEFPPLLCLIHVFKREMKYHKTPRPDLPDECMGRLKIRFLKEVWEFNKKNHGRIKLLLENTGNIKVIHLKNHRQAADYLHNL